jgi:hypothetical protein
VRASCSVSAKISDSEENLPSDVELDAQFEFAIDTLFLAKSKKRSEEWWYLPILRNNQES